MYIYIYIYIKSHTEIHINIKLRYIYYIQIESLIFARKSVSEKEKNDDKKCSLIIITKKDALSFRLLFTLLYFFVTACFFVATMNEHYRNLATLTGRSLRPSFALNTSKKLVLQVFERDRIVTKIFNIIAHTFYNFRITFLYSDLFVISLANWLWIITCRMRNLKMRERKVGNFRSVSFVSVLSSTILHIYIMLELSTLYY